MSKTTITPKWDSKYDVLDLLHPLKVFTELGIKDVGGNLVVLAISEILLSVEEPDWDVECYWV